MNKKKDYIKIMKDEVDKIVDDFKKLNIKFYDEEDVQKIIDKMKEKPLNKEDIMKKKKWTGEELGKLTLNVCSENYAHFIDEDFSSAINITDIDKIRNKVYTAEDNTTYNLFVDFYKLILEVDNCKDNAENIFAPTLIMVKKLLLSYVFSLQALSKLNSYPIIMTEEEYNDFYNTAKNNLKKEPSRADIINLYCSSLPEEDKPIFTETTTWDIAIIKPQENDNRILKHRVKKKAHSDISKTFLEELNNIDNCGELIEYGIKKPLKDLIAISVFFDIISKIYDIESIKVLKPFLLPNLKDIEQLNKIITTLLKCAIGSNKIEDEINQNIKLINISEFIPTIQSISKATERLKTLNLISNLTSRGILNQIQS